MQVLAQAIEGAKSTDHAKVGEYMRKSEFDTVVGKVRFAPNGEWAKSRALMVQFQHIENNDLKQFEKPDSRVVLYPSEWKSGDVVYPYSK